ncbi:hypothetical protein RHECNPAF_730070 [Rhizobium etli CNPAF512]|nr:hypothetical protein RHECNPAF_730070 [Rhizobium etli CNPAF512]
MREGGSRRQVRLDDRRVSAHVAQIFVDATSIVHQVAPRFPDVRRFCWSPVDPWMSSAPLTSAAARP